MLAGIALSSAIALLAFAPNADAHGNLKQPEATFEDGAPTVEWVTLIDNYWDIGSGGDQVGKFKTMAKEKGMSVKDVVLDMVKDKKCGFTRTDVDPQPIPSDGKVKWWGNEGSGFTHQGPCEIYIDDKMVLHGDNCEEEFKGGPHASDQTSDMTVDYSACNGKCTLTIYWLAFQNAQWQAYVNCVPLSGSGGSATQTEGSKTSSQSTETSTTHGSSTEQRDGKSTEAETEKSSNQTPSPEQQTPSTEQKKTEAPSSEQQQNQTPSPDQQKNQPPSTEQKQTQPPSSQNQTPAPQQQPQNQTPAPQQQQTPGPATEQRSLDFNNLNGGTGTVQPFTNLRK